MKKITAVVLLSVTLVLVTGSIHYISADDSTDNQGPEIDEEQTAISQYHLFPEIVVTTKDSKYQLHVQVILRNAQGQLTGVTEGTYSTYIPHKVTDDVFDTILGEKKIVTVDGVKYEKVQFTDTFPGIEYLGQTGVGGLWLVQVCGELINEHIGIECAHIFEVRTNQVTLEDGDTVKTNWTVLRIMN